MTSMRSALAAGERHELRICAQGEEFELQVGAEGWWRPVRGSSRLVWRTSRSPRWGCVSMRLERRYQATERLLKHAHR